MAGENSVLYNPRYLELRAEEVRTIADTLSNPEAKAMMAGVADTYDQMAERAAVLRELLRPAKQKAANGSVGSGASSQLHQ
jgi:hypothetical protein